MNAPFQLATTPLEASTTLLEASAGTGKTFTIAGLFLRLLLERDFSVREILVVTFTEAATEELRGRIRKLLVDAANALRAGETNDAVLQSLLAAHWPRAAEVLARIERALCGFDEAPIFTIHGFCQRMLRDRAFESGVLFDTELVTDPSALHQEIADDYWRANFYQTEAIRLLFALKNNLGPAHFLPLLRDCVSHPSLQLIANLNDQTLESLAPNLEEAFTAARDEWQREKTAIKAHFGSAAAWANKPYNRDDEMAERFALLEQCFSAHDATPEALKVLPQFTNAALSKATSKRSNFPTPQHRFFTLCEEIGAVEQMYLVGVQMDFVAFARRELPQRKLAQKTQSFDDLLTRLRDALFAPGGAALAAGMRTKFKAALMDEFQDTDPVQYAIFKRVFAGGESLLFLIGDPKQAIYGFRGADIFTYLKAARSADRRYTLDTNFRSTKSLVHAVNTLFQNAPHPFVFADIEFRPVQANERAKAESLICDRTPTAPLQIWFWPRNDTSSIAKGRVNSELPGGVAAEITRLLNGAARLGESPVRAEQIAVLVETHRQAQLVQDALTALRVPSVQHTTSSLFATREARELQRVLAAIAQPSRPRLLRAALATDLHGVSALQLSAADEAHLDAYWQRFREYRELWEQHSFIQMFRQWLRREQVRRRLLEFPDGERRLTNVLHLGEVLHQAVTEKRLGITGLVKWLGEQQDPDLQVAEEHQLRLERDDNAVQLVTIHKSKGLEYDIVFCPFLNKSAQLSSQRERTEKIYFHDEHDSLRLTRDLGPQPSEAHRQLAVRERLAENARLLYVALTRARHRCYFVWGNFNEASSAALAWLLHAPPTDAPDLLAAMESHFAALTDPAMRADLATLVQHSRTCANEPTIAVADVPQFPNELYRPPQTEMAKLASRAFDRTISRDWRIASFSWLAAGQRDELPDHDDVAPTPPVVEEAVGIFAFPRGTQPGACLHKIFEQLDFTTHDANALSHLVRDTLLTHGLDAEKFSAAVCDSVWRTLATPLDIHRPDFTLNCIASSERLNEWEFCFPLKQLSTTALAACFARYGDAALLGDFPEQVSRLRCECVRGFLKGFVDLIFHYDGRFYIADWKSNHLGNHVEDYGPDTLRGEMRAKLYLLQYHLYVVALHRYLSLRQSGYDYEQHFGGVYYLFVRGMEPTRPELGVFRDRPAKNLVIALDELLVAAESEVSL